MTVKESEVLKNLQGSIKNMSEKLFGNGTRNGCIDQRLENVESYISELREIMPKMVTRDYCTKRHEVRWSRIVLIIGLAGTWVGLFLRVMEVI
jgi:hypothetical protein